MSTEAERRFAANQALASTRLEGHVPTPAFLADWEAVIAGTLSGEEGRARSLARVRAEQHRISGLPASD